MANASSIQDPQGAIARRRVEPSDTMGGRRGNAVSHLVAGKRRTRESLRETKAVRISQGHTSP